MTKLKTCPFCGGAAIIKKVGYAGSEGVMVRCICCKISTVPVIEGVNTLYKGKWNYNVTREEAVEAVTTAWDTRRAAATVH